MSNPSTVRKLAILAKMSRQPVTAPDLQAQLAAENIHASLRTIQRDLADLALPFNLVDDGSKPKGWYCDSHQTGLFATFDLTTAVTFLMVEKYLYAMLPKAMQETLTGYIEKAKAYLVEKNLRNQRRWDQKIITMARGFQLIPSPHTSQENLEVIYQAVLQEKCLRLEHQSIQQSKPTRYDFHPYGVVIRGERSYLIGHFDGKTNTVKLLTQRISNPKISQLNAEVPEGFDLEHYIHSGQLDEQRVTSKGSAAESKPIKVTLWIDGVLKTLLEETPLSINQQFSVYHGDYLVTAEVFDTLEFRSWLLSMCNRAVLLEPLHLKQEIRDILHNAVADYDALTD
ncbi:helix-turn-helix transcriptional regulator [Enterovibrio sp. FF113]|uniref:helix-turn-helix transcriptional regulator n=1 Tax=Enterovibrio sp. FF113 TaxID=3230010 RepID=UPI00352F6073